MAIRIKWDQYETALLIDTFWKIENNPQEKKKYIEQLSEQLRAKAINEGIDIDDVFRNENGISMQLSPIAHAFFPERPSLTSSRMFEMMVKMYKENRSEFDIILNEAKEKIEKKEKDQFNIPNKKIIFKEWLIKNGEEDSERIVEILEECTKYIYLKRISPKPFWTINEKKEIEKLFCNILSDKEFRRGHNKILFLAASKSFPLYKEFLVDCKNNSFEKATGNALSEEIVEEQTSTNNKVLKVLQENYAYGFNLNSPIELLRFKKKYESMYSESYLYEDEKLVEEICECGVSFNGKLYVVREETYTKIDEVIQSLRNRNLYICYYNRLFELNENWLFEEKIISSEMLKNLLENSYEKFQFKQNYFLMTEEHLNEREALLVDIETVWGDATLKSFSELEETLPYIPLEKIKYALSVGNQFIWNSFEVYTRKESFVVTDNQLNGIREKVRSLCDEKGLATFEELPVEDILAENYELSETAFIDILFDLLSDEFSRSNKALTRIGEKVDAETEIIKYCRDKERCSMQEAETIMKETVGVLRYPVVVEALNKIMIRIDSETFVSDKLVKFDIEGIDKALDNAIGGKVIGMKEITTFGSFPYCGYQWNLYILESFCRRFSRKFRYDCATSNSKNAGAIIRKEFDASYHEVMAEAVAQSGVKLTEKEVFDYLITSGLMLKRQYNDMDGLIKKAENLRKTEGRF